MLRSPRAPLLTIALLTAPLGLAPRAADSAPRIRARVAVPMRDGAKLATSVFLPPGDGPWPCVLARTPYNRRGIVFLMGPYTGAGYALVTQDCRGRFESEGKYDPFRTDGPDGYDTVEWIARQKWSDGKVGMVGASALGMAANLAATQVPPHLRCAFVVVAPASARRNTVYQGGVYRKELGDDWLRQQGVPRVIDEYVRQPPGSSYWDWREIPDFHSRIRIPIQYVGGWFDIFAAGTVENFTGLQSRGAGLAAGNQKLVMGPWAHGRLDGRLRYPGAPADAYLKPAVAIRWFDRWLRGADNGVDREPPVRYYVLGDPEASDGGGCRWRTAASWPPPARPTSWFIAPGRRLQRATLPASAGEIAYRYDPRHPVPTRGGANLSRGGKGPVDQRSIGEREDYVRLASEPLARPLEVAGPVAVDLWVSSDAPDTDFTAKLVDVFPDGYEALVADSILRARYREGLEREVLLKPGEVAPVRIELGPTAIEFARGHRIGLHLSSSNDPRFDPNPNTGKPLRSSEETRVAHNAIRFGPERPARLLLPVVAAATPAEPAAAHSTPTPATARSTPAVRAGAVPAGPRPPGASRGSP